MIVETRKSGRSRRPGLRHVWLMLCFAAIPWAPADAAPVEVWVVTSEDSGPQAEVVEEMRKLLVTEPGEALQLHVVRTAELARTEFPQTLRLVVTVGTQAAGVVLARQPAVPVYCGFLPHSSYASLLATSAPGKHSQRTALYVDQPFDRQLRLIHMALPQFSKAGVVLGPDSRNLQSALRRAAAGNGLELEIEVIDKENQLVRALYRVLEDSDILFAVPDALVFNRQTAQNVLTTAFRIGKPVAGYSRAYVNAGALLAVYSTPAQIGRQMAEALRKLVSNKSAPLPTPSYPAYFTVVTNERLARSYGLELESADVLTRKLAVSEESR